MFMTYEIVLSESGDHYRYIIGRDTKEEAEIVLFKILIEEVI